MEVPRVPALRISLLSVATSHIVCVYQHVTAVRVCVFLATGVLRSEFFFSNTAPCQFPLRQQKDMDPKGVMIQTLQQRRVKRR